jgi:hypothetical protein
LSPFGPQVKSIAWLQSSKPALPLNSALANAYRFQLEPSQSITFGVEGPATLKAAQIFDLKAFEQQGSSLAFLRGAALALGFVLALAILSLYGVRANRAFLVGGAFGFASLLFMALEAGYLFPLAKTYGDLN